MDNTILNSKLSTLWSRLLTLRAVLYNAEFRLEQLYCPTLTGGIDFGAIIVRGTRDFSHKVKKKDRDLPAVHLYLTLPYLTYRT